jgi:hypothetical protein
MQKSMFFALSELFPFRLILADGSFFVNDKQIKNMASQKKLS